ncbi:hypothetical protein MKS88_001279 [Plasmodium brasilianum]|uniref:Uncharacterized protein n=1 Tax=Plasmodium brasilianum TaxID=5824 RepID=A0ACB9YCC3_PLABR|nr:hypothetical protein MKS88_001279 [Plasmodium brasilianum]
MKFFNRTAFFLTRTQLCGNKFNINNWGTPTSDEQKKSSKERDVIHFYTGKENKNLELKLSNTYARNLSESFFKHRNGVRSLFKQGMRFGNEDSTLLFSDCTSPSSSENIVSCCKYEVVETILGDSKDSSDTTDKPYEVKVAEEDEYEDDSEDESGDQYEEEMIEVTDDYYDDDEGQSDDDSEEDYVTIISHNEDSESDGNVDRTENEDINKFENGSVIFNIEKDVNSSNLVTEEELNRKLKKINGNVDVNQMSTIWNDVSTIENKKYHDMTNSLWNWCELLALEYKIPEELILKEWKKVVDFTSDELLKKNFIDNNDFNELIKEGKIDYLDFVYFIKHKRKSWKKFIQKTEDVWRNTLDNNFKRIFSE